MKITHDFHVHTHLSLCANQKVCAEDYVENAKVLGLTKLGFSDHFWDSAISGAFPAYEIQNYNHIAPLKDHLTQIAQDQVKLFFGGEAEYDPANRSVAVTEAVAEQMDYIIVSNSHTHITMPREFYLPYQQHVDFMIRAFEDIVTCPVSKYITAVAHPFQAVACPYPNQILIDMIPDSVFLRLFEKAATADIAFEINVASMIQKTSDEIESMSQIRMFRLAKQSGCKFIFGSDAHSKDAHQWYSNTDFVAELLELKETDFAVIAR